MEQMSDFLYSIQGIAAAVGAVLFWFLWRAIATSERSGSSHTRIKVSCGLLFGLLFLSLVHGYQTNRGIEASHKFEINAMPSSSMEFWGLTGSLSFLVPNTAYLYQRDSKGLRNLFRATHSGMNSVLEVGTDRPNSEVQAAVTQFVNNVDAAAKEIEIKDGPDLAEEKKALAEARARLLDGSWTGENDRQGSNREKLFSALVEFSRLTLEYNAAGSQIRVDFATDQMTESWTDFETLLEMGGED